MQFYRSLEKSVHAECLDSCDAELSEVVLRERQASAFSHSQGPSLPFADVKKFGRFWSEADIGRRWC